MGVASRIGAALAIGLFASFPLGGSSHAAEVGKSTTLAADNQYQACVASAGAVHDAAWAAECERLAGQTDSDRANCLNKLKLPKIYCDASYAPRDPGATCALPDQVATVLDAELANARFRCARERKGEEGKL